MENIKKGNGGAPASLAADEKPDIHKGLGIAEDERDGAKIKPPVSGEGGGAIFRGELTIGDNTWPVEGRLKKVEGE